MKRLSLLVAVGVVAATAVSEAGRGLQSAAGAKATALADPVRLDSGLVSGASGTSAEMRVGQATKPHGHGIALTTIERVQRLASAT